LSRARPAVRVRDRRTGTSLQREAELGLDQARLRDFARSYTKAWGSHDPARVAAHYVPGGTIAINGGKPTEVTEVARSFISAFPDIEVSMDDLVFNDETVEYHWTFTGTNTGPSGTGNSVRISGFEEWRFGDDGLVVESRGQYDQEDYDRQLEHGAPRP
jgi:predicted ester cyclase